MRRAASLIAIGTLAAASSAAQAQPVLHDGAGTYRSDRNFAVELRFGPYSPDVDSEFAGTGRAPHRQFFGKKARLMSQLEVDYQLFQAFGSVAIGASIGYFRENARAFVETGAGNPSADRTGDNTRLALIPTALLAVYRFDVLYHQLGIPFVPYGKLGLNYTIWSVYDGNDNIAKQPNRRGRGGSLGWQASVGVSFLLDVVDPGAARELDGETGINHTHLFIEAQKVDAPAFGRKDTLQVGDTSWLCGLMFEF